jgi:hypothetical protein
MRISLILLILSFLNVKGLTQNFNGKWEGFYFTDGNCKPSRIKIYLQLTQMQSSEIIGFSTTYFSRIPLKINGNGYGTKRYDTTVCNVRGTVKDKIAELREISADYSTLKTDSSDLQQMLLVFKEGRHTVKLKGRWISGRKSCNTGVIKFNKKEL